MPLLSLFLLLACAKAGGPVSPVTLPAGEPVQTRPDVEPSPLRSLLLARHTADLPDRDTLIAHGAPSALRELADTDPHLVVRERALLALSHFNDEATVSFCRDRFRTSDQDKLRAAAIGCSSPGSDEGFQEELLAALQDDDARVGLAALDALRQLPVRERLEGLIADPDVHPEVRRAWEEAR